LSREPAARRRLRAAGVTAALLLAACSRPNAETAAQAEHPACEPVEYALDPGVQASALMGKFRITLVATAGDSAGRRAEGGLELQPAGRADAALVGRTTVPVEAVNAFRVGQLDVSGDSAPGVLVFLRDADRPSIILRLGSGANAQGVMQPIEGEFTALTVRRIDAGGFAGAWRSGAMRDRAAGHFCAVRLSP
jgi:hypothetical protein